VCVVVEVLFESDNFVLCNRLWTRISCTRIVLEISIGMEFGMRTEYDFKDCWQWTFPNWSSRGSGGRFIKYVRTSQLRITFRPKIQGNTFISKCSLNLTYPRSSKQLFTNIMVSVQALYSQAVDLAINPQHTKWLCPALLALDAVLCSLIIWKVPCTYLHCCPFPRPQVQRTKWLCRYRDWLGSLYATNWAVCFGGKGLH